MYRLDHFTLRDMTELGALLRRQGNGAGCMEEAAHRVVRSLQHNLFDEQNAGPACALVRFFKTHSYSDLPPELLAFADRSRDGQAFTAQMKCLTLLATAGSRPEWNERASSDGHQAIPLASKDTVSRAPMIAQLIHQFGLEVNAVLQPQPELLVDLEQRTYNIFHVPEAAGSPHLPAQEEFIIPQRIRSVLGFGGMLPSGNMFAVVLFSRSPIPREAAVMFRTLALSVKLAVLPFDDKHVFATR